MTDSTTTPPPMSSQNGGNIKHETGQAVPNTASKTVLQPLPPQNEAATSTPNPPSSRTGETFILLLFASASTYTGTDSLTLPAPMSLKTLFATLEDRYPGIGKKVLAGCMVSVNLEYVEFEVEEVMGVVQVREGESEGKEGRDEIVVLRAGDEVGIIPPVSSG